MKRFILLSIMISLSLAWTACENPAGNENNDAPTPIAPVEAETGHWNLVKTETSNTIHDVAAASDGAYAVADGGILLKRTDESWVKVFSDGVSGNSNNLYGLAVTDNGNTLWLAGASGRVGRYDVTDGTLDDYSHPMDVTNNFNDVAATKKNGSVNIYLAGDSGKIYYSFKGGSKGSWNEVTPGSGSAINALGFFKPKEGHLVDANETVFKTIDGSSWNKIGIEDANVDFQGIDSDGPEDAWVSGGNGIVRHWNGRQWTADTLDNTGLKSIQMRPDDRIGYAVGFNAAVFNYDGHNWNREAVPANANLHSIILGTSSTPAIAVGAGGTILEK